jgi:predicted phage terminase large subunit-like protein
MTEALDLGLEWEDWLAIEREACHRSLATFVREAWHVLEPAQPYIHGWHIDAVCQHLEAVTHGDITRLLVNVPPGTMKSMLMNVFWPAWEWGPLQRPAMRFIGASHSEALATRDNLKMRRLVQSEWYQERWPTTLTGDQNAKTYFENKETGFRLSCPVSSMTGRRGDRVVWDDPHSVEAAISDAHRETALRVFTETLPTRLNNPDSSAIIVVMQRLHEEDVAGYILEHDLGYEHLMLPMEFEKERRCSTSLGFKDPRKKDGELLFPARFPREVVDRDKKVMGTFAVAGQFQQRPAPRSGGFFEWEQLEVVDKAPRIVAYVRFWDKAGTKGNNRANARDGSARTAGVLMGKGEDGRYYVFDVHAGRWEAPERERQIKAKAETDPPETQIWVEQEPGSGGKESAQATVRNLAGYSIHSERPSGEKTLRAEPYSVQVEAGNVKLLRGRWNKEFIDEHKSFPRGKLKDQIDGASGAFGKLARDSAGPQVRFL